MMFSRLGTRQKFDFFLQKNWFLCNSEIFVYTFQLKENKVLAKSFIPRNSKALKIQKSW